MDNWSVLNQIRISVFVFASIFVMMGACGAVASSDKADVVFVLDSNSVSSWFSKGDAISIKLTEQGSELMLELTKNNIDKPMSVVSADGTELMSAVIRELIGSGSIVIYAADEDRRKRIIDALPPERRKDSTEPTQQ